MKHAFVRIAGLIIFFATLHAWAAEPVVGTWRLTSQEVGGKKTDPDPLTLRVTKSGAGLEFAYSVPVNNIQLVSMKFDSRLDGTESDVKDVQGNKTGAIKITKSGTSIYKVSLRSPNRPGSSGRMTVSADGKTLTSESDTVIPGQHTIHTVQIFSRE